MKPLVHVVDDDPSFLKAVSRLLTLAGHAVKTYASSAEFLARHDPAGRGCVVADLHMPGQDGFELQAQLGVGENPLPVIFLTGQGDIPASVRALKNGAEDFLTKPVRKEPLLDAVKRALARDQATWAEHQHRRDIRHRYESLTPREREILALIVAGRLNKEIAGDVGATERTVKAHRARVMTKMGAQSPAELGRLAHELGITPVA
jgi:FixJ family two-component response regulator